jgi:hypothetical protein
MKYTAALLLSFVAWTLADRFNAADTAGTDDYASQLDSLVPASTPYDPNVPVKEVLGVPWQAEDDDVTYENCQVRHISLL